MECNPPMFGRLHRALCRLPRCKRRVPTRIRGNAAHEHSRLCRLAKATFVSPFTPSSTLPLPCFAGVSVVPDERREREAESRSTAAPPSKTTPPSPAPSIWLCGGSHGGPTAAIGEQSRKVRVPARGEARPATGGSPAVCCCSSPTSLAAWRQIRRDLFPGRRRKGAAAADTSPPDLGRGGRVQLDDLWLASSPACLSPPSLSWRTTRVVVEVEVASPSLFLWVKGS
jgi:hypothetical protein